jgi:L,D-transpeptidase ErfK/SrfK
MHILTATLCLALAFGSVASGEPPRMTLGGETRTHIIAPGEALSDIARRNGLAYPAVARANGIENPNLIRVGKTLVLPTRYILPARRADGIVVNIPEFRLYLYREDTVRAVFPIAVGLPTWETPRGEFAVINKVKNPAWYMPPDLARREEIEREIIPAGPNNPLGDFWIGTSLAHTGIHGTNVPMSIGRALSHGCMRLYPEQIDSLFRLVAVGDSGNIVYQPVKVATDGDDILVEVHPDVYDEASGLEHKAEAELRALGVWERVDKNSLQQVVAQARGIPVSVKMK